MAIDSYEIYYKTNFNYESLCRNYSDTLPKKIGMKKQIWN